MNELSLFTGAGGGVLAGKLLGWRTVGYVEWDAYCQAIIRQRQIDGIYDDAPIFGDIRQFDGKPWRGIVDIITAGFPCQPFSVAGKRAGADDERNMWPDTLRVISEVRPRYALLENVPGLISAGYLGTILGGLAACGYDAEWCVLGADDVGAPHRRKRLWVLAYAKHDGWTEAKGQRTVKGMEQRTGRAQESNGIEQSQGSYTRPILQANDVAHASGIGSSAGVSGQEPGQEGNAGELVNESHQGRITWWHTDPADVGDTLLGRHASQEEQIRPRRDGSKHTDTRSAQPRLGRVAHGVAHRVDRLKAIGNGQVPFTAVAAWQMLRGRIDNNNGGMI